MGSLATIPLVLIFLGCAVVIWVSGVKLSTSTDALDARFGLGSAFGGLLLLAIATNLPELVITLVAAANHNLGIAVGNIMGGIALQTLVLAPLDAAADPKQPLSYLVGSLVLVMEGALVIVVTVAAMMTTQLPISTNVAGISPGTLAVFLLWLGGIVLVVRTRNNLRWKIEAEGSTPGRTHSERQKSTPPQHKDHGTGMVLAIFSAAAIATMVAGYFIERSGDELAGRAGLSGAIFGATFLAAATALPQLSSGLGAVRIGDNQLAMSDIFGGNAVLPPMLLFADVIAGKPALPAAHKTDIWIAGLGIVLTGVYMTGIILRPRRTRWRMGPDSIAAIVLYAIGIGGLFLIGNG